MMCERCDDVESRLNHQCCFNGIVTNKIKKVFLVGSETFAVSCYIVINNCYVNGIVKIRNKTVFFLSFSTDFFLSLNMCLFIVV